MKRIYFLVLIFAVVKCNSQPVHLLKDKKYLRHWESYANCCVAEIDTGVFKGVFLDGNQLSKNDVNFANIIGVFFQIESSRDSLHYLCPIKSELDFFYTKLCLILKSDSVVKKHPCLQDPNFFCQYIELLYNNRTMLLISFQRNGSQNKKKNKSKQFELFKLIYSRISFFSPLDSRYFSCDGFWILYDVDKECIIKMSY